MQVIQVDERTRTEELRALASLLEFARLRADEIAADGLSAAIGDAKEIAHHEMLRSGVLS